MKEKRDDIRYEDSLYLVIATMIDKTQLADSIWSTGRKSFWTKLKNYIDDEVASVIQIQFSISRTI